MQGKEVFSQKRADELISRAQSGFVVQFTPFLDPASAHELSRKCVSAKLEHMRFGGYAEAERAVIALGEGAQTADFPIKTLEITWDGRFGRPEHHDLLGAVMALGIKRECIGDIVLSEGRAFIFVLKTIAPVIMLLTEAGRVPVSISEGEFRPSDRMPGKIVTATFKSLRLDAVIAEGMRVSRADAAALIAQGRVLLSFAPCLKSDAHVKTGDVISIRGMGRIVIGEMGGKSKKDRIYLTMEVFSRSR